MKITITLECENDAFYPYPLWEIKRILEDFCNGLDVDLTPDQINPYTRGLYDINGNKVGLITLED